MNLRALVDVEGDDLVPAATNPRWPSRETATARAGPGSASRATTALEDTSTNATSGRPVATSTTRADAACGAGSSAASTATATPATPVASSRMLNRDSPAKINCRSLTATAPGEPPPVVTSPVCASPAAAAAARCLLEEGPQVGVEALGALEHDEVTGVLVDDLARAAG